MKGMKAKDKDKNQNINSGDRVITPEGPGFVLNADSQVTVKLDIKPGYLNTDTLEFPLKQICSA